jgi:hypothetical protein
MPKPKFVDAGTVRRALELAGEDIRERKILGEIMVHGSWACLLRYSWTDDGSRIEANISFDGKSGVIRQATAWAGRRVGLPDGWVDDILPFLFGEGPSSPGGFPTGMYPTWERPGLRVLAAPPRLLIPMVFLATLRPMSDIGIDDLEPAVRIAAGIGIRTGGHLKALVDPYLKRKEKDDGDMAREIGRRLSFFEAALDRFGYRPAFKARPKSIAEVADLARKDQDDFGPASGEFGASFYIEEDAAARQAMLNPAPVPTGYAEHDAVIGAMGEHLALRWGLKVPAWTREAAFMGGARPYFWPDSPEARDIQIVETPPSFRRRLLFSYAEPLMNAKFPHASKVKMPFWD